MWEFRDKWRLLFQTRLQHEKTRKRHWARKVEEWNKPELIIAARFEGEKTKIRERLRKIDVDETEDIRRRKGKGMGK